MNKEERSAIETEVKHYLYAKRLRFLAEQQPISTERSIHRLRKWKERMEEKVEKLSDRHLRHLYKRIERRYYKSPRLKEMTAWVK